MPFAIWASSGALNFFAPTAKGLEYLLVDELIALGALNAKAARAGVRFEGELEVGYRACLWSRLASRVLLPIATFRAPDADTLYAGVRAVQWSLHIPRGSTIAVRATVSQSAIDHSHFAALRVKDAVVDLFRDQDGWRPNVDTKQPDVLLHLHLRRDEATLSVDLAGRPLHQRGYRIAAGPAPLKETLAAAVLMRGGWLGVAEQGGALVDPMCGSGTLLIEGAMMVADQAPGIAQPNFGLERWAGHNASLWQELIAEARERWRAGRERLPVIAGADASGRALQACRQNLVRANLYDQVNLEKTPIEQPRTFDAGEFGLVVCNPPYGERVETTDLKALYEALGATLSRDYSGWRAALLVADDDLSRSTGVRAERRYQVFNGALPCRIVTAEIADVPRSAARRPLGPQALMVRNRLEKNLRGLRKRLRREEITCFRLYDADLPEYAAAVDVYDNYVHVQEYAPPASVPLAKANARLRDLCQAVGEVLDLPPDHVITKRRQKQQGPAQYQRIDASASELLIKEAGLTFLVNLTQYIDTGIFLDSRNLRARIRDESSGKRFLNLFAYTAAASVYAAAGGATQTVSVDLSNTYCAWARKNFTLNQFLDRDQNQIYSADCAAWLREHQDSYDLVLVDPPTWSNSKSTEQDFSVQRDHAELLSLAWDHVTAGGTLYFCTNFRKFKLDPSVESLGDCKEISRQTVPFDFGRRTPHRCWQLKKTR